ncbi:MAG: NAD-dependent epimerase/dehydratase family protein, partial [Fulvivirga sp.]|uniref:NAD-dependent epimerase/dehydratase family protein n=1 Tax=Fulvivirga sp. TaxID=1931237 RepID=UPI0032EBE587
MKKVLIIGSKGFIGSALTRYLRSVNYEVFEADIVQEYGNPSYLQIDPNGSDYEFEQVFKIKTYDACIN